MLISFALHMIPIITNLRFAARKVEERRPPLSVKFIQRAPRLVKPLELARRPTVVQRQLTRRVTTSKAMTPRVMTTAAAHGGTVLASLARPGETVSRSWSGPQRLELGPEIIAGAVKSEKESSMKNLGEDLLRANEMDYGRFSSFAVQNPKDKRDVKGFIHLALIRYETNFRDASGEPDWNTSPRALPNIAEYINNHTGIEATAKYVYTLDTDEIITKKMPFIFIQGHNTFEMSDAECANLGRYLRDGGFLLIDDSRFLQGGPFDRAARDVLKRALGEDAVFEKLPNDHRLYHCYFDFEGPPAGDDVVSTWDRPAGSKTIYEFMEAIFLDGRMIVLFSNKSLNNAWNADIHWRQGGNTRQIQFGVNIVVYVLTQPGGYTQQAARYR